MAELPDTVVVPTPMLIEMAGTLLAFPELPLAAQGRDSDVSMLTWNLVDELMQEVGLAEGHLSEVGPQNEQEAELYESIDRRAHEITASLLAKFAAWALAESDQEIEYAAAVNHRA